MTPAFTDPIYVTRPLLPDLDRVTAKLRDVWESQWLSNGGAQHRTLEEALRIYLKVPRLSLFNNGTIGLMVAVQSLRLQGEVITTPFTFPATTHVLAWNGISPVFCDIHPQTLTIDPSRIERLITSRTTGILGVHVYGIPCHVEEIQVIADRHGRASSTTPHTPSERPSTAAASGPSATSRCSASTRPSCSTPPRAGR